jgi:hypothetical protein
MTPLYLKDIGSVIVVGKSATLSQQLRAIAALADPRQDVDASAPGYTPGLSKQVQS